MQLQNKQHPTPKKQQQQKKKSQRNSVFIKGTFNSLSSQQPIITRLSYQSIIMNIREGVLTKQKPTCIKDKNANSTTDPSVLEQSRTEQTH